MRTPTSTPIIDATPINVSVKARTSTSGNVTLTVVADHDLKTSSNDVIPIGNLTWLVGGNPGLLPGTMDATTAHNVGSWTGSGNFSGTQTLRLVNDWAYNTGSYTATLTYTLTAP